ncbi:MAG TPA: GNAT family N-acetyltransferase [Terriglobales bacterium]|nr:GNAT family N-acetyltransferase [Terriglobales bacterium]
MATGEATGKREVSVTGVAGEIMIRHCHDLDEMRACVLLQKEVWNFTDIELVPLRLFVVASKIGGQVIGAFFDSKLVGFAFAIPALRNGCAYLHSHMLAVHSQYRDAGLGRRLKLAQRDDALDRGIDLIEWTYDPLEIKNAYLNIEKLGAISRRYNVNQYGITSSPLQAGLPTDRLIAEWWLKSKRVENRLRNGLRGNMEPSKAIIVPAEIYDWKANPGTRARAKTVQDQNRTEFLQSFQDGLAVLGYERGQDGSGKFLLGTWDESWAV